MPLFLVACDGVGERRFPSAELARKALAANAALKCSCSLEGGSKNRLAGLLETCFSSFGKAGEK